MQRKRERERKGRKPKDVLKHEALNEWCCIVHCSFWDRRCRESQDDGDDVSADSIVVTPFAFSLR